MLFVFDTNVLISAALGEGICRQAFEIGKDNGQLARSEETFKELAKTLEKPRVAIKKFKLSQHEIVSHVDFLLSNCELLGVTVVLQKKAIDLHFRYQFSFYDSLIIAAALEANCAILIFRRPEPRPVD